MRIDAYNQIAQIYGNQTTVKTTKTQSKAGLRDQLTISQAGRDYQVAKNAVSGASDIRESKVAQIKSQIEAGTYRVSDADLASRMLERYGAVL